MPLPFSRRALQTAPSFSRDFAGLKTLDHGVGPAITFTRASNATFFDASGTLQTAANDTPRFDHDPATGASRGLLIEELRTNLLLNSATLATQTVTVTAVAHTLSFYGTGEVVLSGVHSATVTGTGAFPTRTTLTFTPTAGSLTATVTGTVSNAQLEIGSFATSYIPTTTAAATRATEQAIVNPVSSFYNPNASTLFAEIELRGLLPSARYVQFDDETNNNRVVFGLTSGVAVQNFTTTSAVNTLASSVVGALSVGSVYKSAGAYAANNMVSAQGGTLGTVDTSGEMPLGIVRLRLDGQLSPTPPRGHWIRRFAYWPRRLSDQLLQQLTT